MPISLLIMSRAFTLQAPDPAKALAQSISAMDDDVVTEVRSGVRCFLRCWANEIIIFDVLSGDEKQCPPRLPPFSCVMFSSQDHGRFCVSIILEASFAQQLLLLLMSQVMIEAASSEDQKTPEYRTRKLESLTRQNELIEEENRKREEAEQAQVRGCASMASCGHSSRSHQNPSCGLYFSLYERIMVGAKERGDSFMFCAIVKID